MVLKEVILRVSTLGGEVVVLKDLILTVSTLGGGSGGLERIDFNNFYYGRKWWS